MEKISSTLFWKLLGTFFILISLAAVALITISSYYSNRLFLESNQKLHVNLADYIIEEKFTNEKPYNPDGSVNKPLFGDLMHDMMAVNRNIEVYLLDEKGMVEYCVVLNKFKFEQNSIKVDMTPIQTFIQQKNSDNIPYLLGQDPQNLKVKKPFSAAKLTTDNKEGYLYIVLNGKDSETIQAGLFGNYLWRVGGDSMLIIIVAAFLIGSLIIWYLTKNLQQIVLTMQRFEKGDYQARVNLKASGELAYVGNQFNKMADTIYVSIEKVKSAEKLRRELIANISHDLRTPISVLYGYAEALQEKGQKLTEEKQKTFLKAITNNAEKLNKLVNELFELSKLEARNVQIEKAPILVNELIYDTIEEYQLVADKKNIRLRTNTSMENGSIMVLADPNLIDRVLQNLLDNAIKFTPENSDIHINAIEKGDKVAISVQDHGVGIPTQEIPNIFNRYYTKESLHSDRGGTGLGLAIAKHIVELHNATFKISSELNKGSTFSFELPVYG